VFCSFQGEIDISYNIWAQWSCPYWAAPRPAWLEVAVIPREASPACWTLLLVPGGAAQFQCHPNIMQQLLTAPAQVITTSIHVFFINQLGDLPSARFPFKKVHLLIISWASCLLARHLQQRIISASLMSNKTAKNYILMLSYAILVGITLEMHEFHVSCWALLYFHVPISTIQGNFISVLSSSQNSVEYFVFVL